MTRAPLSSYGNSRIRRVVRYAGMLLLLASCGHGKQLPVAQHTDSVRVEIRERLVHDTVTFTVPEIREKIVTRDTSSHLENEWAQSDAVVSGGFLSHSLGTRPHTVYVPVAVEVHDTTVVEKEAQTVIQEVERQLTWWQKTWILLGKTFAFLVIALVLAFALKFFVKV